MMMMSADGDNDLPLHQENILTLFNTETYNDNMPAMAENMKLQAIVTGTLTVNQFQLLTQIKELSIVLVTS